MISDDLFYYSFIDLYIYIFISFVITLIFVYILYIYSDSIDSFATYHRNIPFFLNVMSRFRSSIILSIPFIIVFYIYLSELFYSGFINFIFSVITSMNLLLIIRLFSNPTRKLMFIKIKQSRIIKRLELSGIEKDECVRHICLHHKKRVINFSYTLLYGALFLIYIKIIFSIIYAPYFSIPFYISKINMVVIFYSFNIYIVSIFIFVLLGETILLKLGPFIIDEW